MAKQKDLTPLEGVISAVNDKGVKLEGGDGWLNFSKYAEGLPEFHKGQRVTLLLDGDFVMGARGDASGATPRRIEDSEVSHGWSVVAGVSRDVLIVRQSSLKAAVDLCAIVAQTNPDAATSASVLAVAEKFTAWVLRADGAHDPRGSGGETGVPR